MLRPSACLHAAQVEQQPRGLSVSHMGFLAKLDEATKVVGAKNILDPKAAKAALDADKGALLLDVQDPGSDSIPGAYSASLGTLPFKASTDLPEFKDPKIADRKKSALIVVTCALGGQAKLGAKLLVDYGFKNVKVVEGGCVAWKKMPADKKAKAAPAKAKGTKRARGA